jgi:hypothetical protein
VPERFDDANAAGALREVAAGELHRVFHRFHEFDGQATYFAWRPSSIGRSL